VVGGNMIIDVLVCIAMIVVLVALRIWIDEW
jgi:hypothetical protein